MLKKPLNNILIIGALAILGIIALQLYWVNFAYHIKRTEFEQRVNLSLRNVAKQLAFQSGIDLPKKDLIVPLSSNEFLVNFNDIIKLDILEDYLIRELDIVEPGINFEYAVYDCFSGDLIYGDCCQVDSKTLEELKTKIPEMREYTYYFVVRFPEVNKSLAFNLKFFLLLGLFTVIVVFAYIYAVRILFEQKKLSELQKDFVDNMTHEFKTPLTSIRLASNVLLQNENVASDTKLRKYSEIIKGQSDKLTSHVERLLDLIRSDDTLKLKVEDIDLVEMINSLINEIKHDTIKPLEIEFLHKPDSIKIKADRYHLQNSLMNILDNAIKYNDKEIMKLEIGLDIVNSVVSLSIKDNGIGLSRENKDKIFGKFYRVQKGNIHDVKGFGLGLYYVKNIIDLHGWTIEVESEENNWTKFIIKINNQNGF